MRLTATHFNYTNYVFDYFSIKDTVGVSYRKVRGDASLLTNPGVFGNLQSSDI